MEQAWTAVTSDIKQLASKIRMEQVTQTAAIRFGGRIYSYCINDAETFEAYDGTNWT